MRPFGRKIQRVLEGHRNCSICQPDTKAGKALERREAEKEIDTQLEDMVDTELLSDCPCCEPVVNLPKDNRR